MLVASFNLKVRLSWNSQNVLCLLYRFGWLFRMAVLVSVHSGATTAVQVLSYILLNGNTIEVLNLFVQMQCEIEFYYHDVLKETLKTCVASLNKSNATLKTQMVRFIFWPLLFIIIIYYLLQLLHLFTCTVYWYLMFLLQPLTKPQMTAQNKLDLTILWTAYNASSINTIAMLTMFQPCSNHLEWLMVILPHLILLMFFYRL
jgi:hypothetical protein